MLENQSEMLSHCCRPLSLAARKGPWHLETETVRKMSKEKPPSNPKRMVKKANEPETVEASERAADAPPEAPEAPEVPPEAPGGSVGS